MKKLLFLIAVLLLNFQVFAQVRPVNVKRLGSDIQKIVRKVYQASVWISPYDPSKQITLPGAFSGVVVDTAGHILSAAHAVKPDQLYQVIFPNGKKQFARGLGRIVSNDAAMLKIEEKGKWAYAPMGWSSSLQKDVPCISIAYPGTVEAKTPTVRFGYIAELEATNGFMRSTCLMEPGDSGGPVFDMKGRVIGLHSRIDMPLDDNYEVPIDAYRKYWNALLEPQNYAVLPTENDFVANPNAKDLKVIAGLDQLNRMIAKNLSNKIAPGTVKIKSPYKGKGINIALLGTLVKIGGLIHKDRSFVISKSSMVSNVVSVELNRGNFVPAKVVARDKTNDLVLLQIEQGVEGGIDLTGISNTTIKFTDIGKPLVSPRPHENPIVSIMGNTQINIAKVPSSAYIGLSVKMIGGKVAIASIMPGGPAIRAAMAVGDELLNINGKPIRTETDFREELESYTSNDTLIMDFERNGVRLEKRIAVKVSQPGAELHVASRFEDGRSERYSGFDKVIIHDGRLKPAECGGPLFGIDGKFYGINIARLSRTSSLAISAEVLGRFVKDGISKIAID
jgi:serine protease Do